MRRLEQACLGPEAGVAAAENWGVEGGAKGREGTRPLEQGLGASGRTVAVL